LATDAARDAVPAGFFAAGADFVDEPVAFAITGASNSLQSAIDPLFCAVHHYCTVVNWCRFLT
jgi:hypothetical protein